MGIGVREQMEKIITIVITTIIIFYTYKQYVKKIEKKVVFYKNIEELNISKSKKINLIITSLLLTIEVTIIISLIYWPYRNLGIILGIILQMFYLIILIKNFNKEFKNNCNCYNNIPKNVDIRSVANNILIMFLYLILFIVN